MTRQHTFTDDALADHDTVALVDLLAAGEVRSAELVDAALARLAQVDAPLGVTAHLDADRARREAQDPRPGFFSGVPFFVKDNAAVAGMPTQQGTDAFAARVEPADGDYARLVGNLGLVTLGKTRLSEYGFHAAVDHPRLGPVRTPWNPAHYAGASSAGAAVAVAAGVVPVAHANDGGGSIRIPAAVNGLVGLKPSRDRVPQDKDSREMPVRIVADGVVSRSVRDTAAFLREAERVYRNPALPPVGDVRRPLTRRLKVAMVTEGVGRHATPEVRELTLQTAALLESLGHRVEEIEQPVPGAFADEFLRYWGFLALVLLRTGRWRFGRDFDVTKCDNLSRGLARHAARNLHRLPAAIRSLGRSRRYTSPTFDRYDVLLCPTLATATPEVGYLDPMAPYEQVLERLLDWVAFTPLQNATGEPSISLPLATTASGLPQGMLFSAPLGRDAQLLHLAYELEDAAPWARIQG